jgi:hypothetical protein
LASEFPTADQVRSHFNNRKMRNAIAGQPLEQYEYILHIAFAILAG